jgi:hypothetical protein|tara:strand:- start:1183 stop:1335 length:153 start_codon:yes stop_codon:yes gene_type:complete
MEKLLVRFESNPNRDNANRIYNYELKHPFSVCALNQQQIDILNKSKEMRL